jgi:hypothetical protein
MLSLSFMNPCHNYVVSGTQW